MDKMSLKLEIEGYQLVTVLKANIVIDQRDIVSLNFVSNQCLLNSYKVAKKTGAECVEGFALCEVDGKIERVIRHCWNKLNNLSFDVTEEFAPVTRSDLKSLREKIRLHRFKMEEFKPVDYEVDARNNGGVMSFLSGAIKLTDKLNALDIVELNNMFDLNCINRMNNRKIEIIDYIMQLQSEEDLLQIKAALDSIVEKQIDN